MKKILLGLALLTLTLAVNAQVRWPFGNAYVVTNQTNDTLSITVTGGLNYYAINNDTTVVMSVNSNSELRIGDLLIIYAAEATGSADTLRYSTNITGLEDAIPANKTKVITFIYNGTAWVKSGVEQIN